MKKHEFLRRIAEILVPQQSEEFFQYLLHTSDENGGFLRTRYCYSEKSLPDDSNCDYQVKRALITLQKQYDLNDLLELYDNDRHTRIKLQVHFGEYQDEDDFYMESEWASSVGFSYPVKIDMENGTYEISEFVYEKKRHNKIGRPKYSTGDCVRFHLFDSQQNHTLRDGTIVTVDAFGTIEQREEPSYDIEITENNEECLYKHIRESDICYRLRRKSLKDYLFTP